MIHRKTKKKLNGLSFRYSLFSFMIFLLLARCGGDLSGPTGTIYSPEHPLQYSNNAICDWKIQCGAGQNVEIKFNTFDVEFHASCQ